MNNSAWKSKSIAMETPWGTEFQWNALAGCIHGKVLNIRAGYRTSLKYYEIKDEVLYIMSGRARIMYADQKYLVGSLEHKLMVELFEPGDCLNVQKGCPYRIEAIDDCIIIEIGTRGTTDMVRLLDDYGRDCDNKGSMIKILEELND